MMQELARKEATECKRGGGGRGGESSPNHNLIDTCPKVSDTFYNYMLETSTQAFIL